jgi:cell wall-associated NlpC family hydrolase
VSGATASRTSTFEDSCRQSNRRARSARLKAPAVLLGIGAIAAGLLTVTAAGASAVATPHDPRGRLDGIALTGDVVSLRGWSFDPDLPGTVRIVITDNGVPASSTNASRSRPDVGVVYKTAGSTRGFAGTLKLAAGKHSVCAVAGDLGLGNDTQLGCKVFNVPKETGASTMGAVSLIRPVGRFDAFTQGAGRVSVRGWAVDPDAGGPINYDVTIGGQSIGSGVANAVRPDVHKAHPLYNSFHGYAGAFVAPSVPGNYELCVVAVNNARGGNTIVGCKIITIRPIGEPSELGTAAVSAAAAAIQAQAIASGAVTAAAFNGAANNAARISIATRALLNQATGRGPKPPAVAGVPKFAVATSTKVVDEQAVMGRTPTLGSYPAAKKGGRAGAAASLQLYGGDALGTPGAAGDGIVGAAAILAPNGSTVHPTLPTYAGSSLRAEVAIDAALAHLGDSYVWAAAGPSTFDCSGLTQWAYAKAGVGLTHYTGAQAVQGVRVQPSQLLPGDLLLFGSDLHHVGMYLGAGYMLDAPYTAAYVRVDQVSWFSDFTLAVRP